MSAARQLEGAAALVTGAAHGIGLASAVRLAEAGASVMATDLDQAGLDQLDLLAAERDLDIRTRICDVTREDDVVATVKAMVDSYGRLDVLHANAGIGIYQPLEEMSSATSDRIIDVNLKGPIRCAKAAIAAMRDSGGGSIIFTSSVQATHSLPGCVVYAATKAGLHAAARTLALEVGRANIRVNSVSPGTIDTPMLERDLEGMNPGERDSFLDKVANANALARIGRPEDIGDAVVFLASSASAYITGTDIRVDGGFTAVKSF